MKKIFLVIVLGITIINAGSKAFAPIIMGDIVSFIPYIKEDIGPDLEIINTVIVDSFGNAIDENNKYEPGDSIKFRITLRNAGDENIPDRDAYYTNITMDGSTTYRTISIPELINLAPNKTVTFIVDMDKAIRNGDDNKSIQFDININKSILNDNFWERNLFPEKYKQNNISNILTLDVYKTDVSVLGLSVKIRDKYSNILRDNNTIDISEDNIDGKYASYCCKVHNNGSHTINYSFGRNMLFKTGVIGNWYNFFGPEVNLQPNETSSDVCVDIELPKDFVAGDYNYTVDMSRFHDLNINNNIESMSYSISN